jgi:hypothetical protein
VPLESDGVIVGIILIVGVIEGDGEGLDPVTTRLNPPPLDVFTNVKPPFPLIFFNSIGMDINIITSSFAYHSAIVHCIIQLHYTHENKSALL